MTTKLTLSPGIWHQLNTEYAVLITGGPFRLFMNGNEAPDAESPSHMLTGPITIPQGVGAFVKAYDVERSVVVSNYVPSTEAPVIPFDVASPEEE